MLKNNKKAMALVYLVMYGIVIALCAFYFFHTYKNAPQNTEFVGQVFLDSYGETKNSLKDLYYIQKSADYSIYESISNLAKKGFYYDDVCSTNNLGYVMWKNVFPILQTMENGEVTCYPDKNNIKINYALLLNEELNKYFEGYPPSVIPKNNYDFAFNEKEKALEIEGIPTQKITNPPNPLQYKEKVWPILSEKDKDCLSKEGYVPILGGGDLFKACAPCPKKAKCEDYLKETYCQIDPCNLGCTWDNKCKKTTSTYAITPSFKTEISYNFIKRFNEYVEKAKEIEKNIKDCLIIGSEKPHDDDLTTCASVNRLKEEITDINNYETIWETTLTDYTVLFKIEDSSFNNPYSDEKLIIKYGIRFLDKFPPPATEIVTDNNKRPLKRNGLWYLIWKTNNASDVVGYKIYYKKIEKTLDGREIPSTPPTDIEKMDNKNSPIIISAPVTEWLITGLEGDYYFFIVAGDDSNTAQDILTKRVTIPTIEEAQQEEATDLSALFTIE